MISTLVPLCRLAAGTLLAACLALPARAGMITHCMEPVIFPQSDVNLVILPYALDGPAHDLTLRPNTFATWANEAARALSTLIQLDALSSLRYPAGMAAVQLFTENDTCTVEDVRKRVEPQLEDGKGVVYLWGSFIERDGEMFVQSYVEFYRKNRSGSMRFEIPVLNRTLAFEGALPQAGLGFAPQILNADDIGGIKAAAQSARAISSAPGGPADRFLPDDPTKPFAFYVTDIDSSGWMRVRSLGGGSEGEGWIPARPAWPLRSRLPELEFVEAAMGFLAAELIKETRAETHWAGPWRQRHARARAVAGAAVERFLAASRPRGGEPDIDSASSVALALVMRGALTLGNPAIAESDDNTAAKELREAARDLSGAAGLIPYQSETRNLSAIALAGLSEVEEGAADRAAREWRRAISLAPGDDAPSRNLAAFYRALSTAGKLGLVGVEQQELAARLQYLER